MNRNENEQNKEYEIINLGYEYPGMTGGVKWAIITDLSQEELDLKFSEELSIFKPYVIMTCEQGEALHEYRRNENKHEMRRIRHHDIWGYTEGATEYCNSIFSKEEPEDTVIEMLNREALISAIDRLPEKQRRRCKLYFLMGLSEEEIALLEGISQQNVSLSINRALVRLRKIIKK